MNKSALKDALLKLEQTSVQNARAHRETYLKGALLDSVTVSGSGTGVPERISRTEGRIITDHLSDTDHRNESDATVEYIDDVWNPPDLVGQSCKHHRV